MAVPIGDDSAVARGEIDRTAGMAVTVVRHGHVDRYVVHTIVGSRTRYIAGQCNRTILLQLRQNLRQRLRGRITDVHTVRIRLQMVYVANNARLGQIRQHFAKHSCH